MLTRRIIPCLDVRDGVVVKGVQFRNHVILGDIVPLARAYRDQGADELVFYDITASAEGRMVDTKWIAAVAAEIDIPFCVAGGIRSVEQARQVLQAGADKISVNSPALERPELISELAAAFGRQCVVVGIDSQRQSDGRLTVHQYTGSEQTIQRTAWSTIDWLIRAQELGAGEFVLNCMNADGTKAGFDLEQLQAVRPHCQVPLIASGGAGCAADFRRAFLASDVDGALAAGIFHRRELIIPDLKQQLFEEHIDVRLA